jgi:hypothetical protein
MMTEMTLERLRAHRNNVHRYRKLLATRLSDLERAYIERRLEEERACVQALLPAALPQHFRSGVLAATTRPEMDALLHPADAFLHPMDVVEDCDLTSHEKRAILSAWAVDACAVKETADLTRSPRAEAVSFDDILDALRMLDSNREFGADAGGDRGDMSPRRRGRHPLAGAPLERR